MNKANLVICGTGKRAKWFITTLQRELSHEVDRIVSFTDKDETKHANGFCGYPVVSLEEAIQLYPEAVYVICIAESEEVFSELENRLGCERGKKLLSDRDYLRQSHLENLQRSPLELRVYEACLSDNAWERLVDQCAGNGAAAVTNAILYSFMDDVAGLADRLGSPPESMIHVRTIGIYVTQLGGGGAERVVSNLMPYLLNEGYRVVLITRECSSDKEYNTPDGIERDYIREFLWEDSAAFFTEWENIILSRNIDAMVFHIPYEGPELTYVMVLSKLLGIKFLVENHTSHQNFISQRGLRGHDKIYRIADHMVVLSESDEEYWNSFGCRCSYIPNPCVSSDVNIASLETKQIHNVVLWVGRINEKYKGILDVVPIMKRVVNVVPDAKLMIVGASQVEDDERELRERIAAASLDGAIQLCGAQKDISTYYQSSDVFLMTSPGEGFPMALAEAKAYGLPVVMYELSYLELVKDGKGVISVGQGEADAAADAIVSLLTNIEMWRRKSVDSLESMSAFVNYDIGGAWNKVLGNGLAVE